ncbi:MAG: hypothetical protein ACRDG4_01025 [Chloroflexota bacterium]
MPSFFWRFLTDPRAVPGGWLHDIGLPLTPAVRAIVTKGSLGTRTITIQALQYAVLTYDPRNPPASQVERANISSAYAVALPRRPDSSCLSIRRPNPRERSLKA